MSYKYEKDPVADMIYQKHLGENGILTGKSVANIQAYQGYEKKKEDARKAASGNTDSKVICTELVRQGRMSRSDLVLGVRYFKDYLTERHERGYHAWGLPAVRGMRKSTLQSSFWRVLAQARADAIAAHYGDARRGSVIKSAVLHGFNAVCWIIGGFVSARDWQELYDQRHA